MDDRKILTNFFDGAPVTKNMIKMFAIIALAMVFEQADNYNFSFVAPTLVKMWGLSLQQIGTCNSVFMIGMLIGTFLGGFFSDRWGRKKTLIGASFVFSLCTLANGFAPNFEIFMLMRCLTGIGISAVLIVAGPYLIEMLPSDKRGRWAGLALGVGYLGIPGIAIFCKTVIPMGPEHWRLVYVAGAAGLLIVLFGVRWLEETPRWLVSKGRVREAEQAVERVVGPGYKSDLSQVPTYEEKVPIREVISDMFSKKLVKNTLVLLIIYCLYYPGGLIFINFASTLLVNRGFSIEAGLQLSTLMSLGMVCGPFLASIVAEWGGRKIPIVVMSVGVSILSLIYAYSEAFPAMCVIAVLFCIVMQAGVALSTTYLAELFPTKIRNAAAGLVSATGRVSTIIIMLFFPLIHKNFGFIGVYVFLFAVFIFTALIVGIFGIRTSGVTLEKLTS